MFYRQQSKCQKCRATILFQKLKEQPNQADFFLFLQFGLSFTNDYILEVGNLGDTEAADNADFNALEVPPGGVAESYPFHPV